MRAGPVMRWLALVAIPVLAVGHGFAGPATHLPGHPDDALAVVAASFSTPQACGVESHDDSGHDETACEIVTSGGPHPWILAAGRSTTLLDDLHPALLWRGATVPSRSPPKPSLAALSVLRI
ncbi:hypothetical protein [Streptomyces gobiensis]|uniref:hypothetical protein n=1 Tax=Streptomyces gobiensis TaxID=2875706 RepID=UPI001E418835|nr:hypothetical protein [Streptomyces gobiensis]UGY94418.1 hypothetical protein test1122_23585 [Streptomyces gobiensis]